jgi:hypothetical protein
LARAERRSIAGRWKTIACLPAGSPAQAMRPPLGAISPWHRRSSMLLPAPLGPTMTVRVPAASVRLKSETIRTPPMSSATLSSVSGRGLAIVSRSAATRRP